MMTVLLLKKFSSCKFISIVNVTNMTRCSSKTKYLRNIYTIECSTRDNASQKWKIYNIKIKVVPFVMNFSRDYVRHKILINLNPETVLWCQRSFFFLFNCSCFGLISSTVSSKYSLLIFSKPSKDWDAELNASIILVWCSWEREPWSKFRIKTETNLQEDGWAIFTHRYTNNLLIEVSMKPNKDIIKKKSGSASQTKQVLWLLFPFLHIITLLYIHI